MSAAGAGGELPDEQQQYRALAWSQEKQDCFTLTGITTIATAPAPRLAFNHHQSFNQSTSHKPAARRRHTRTVDQILCQQAGLYCNCISRRSRRALDSLAALQKVFPFYSVVPNTTREKELDQELDQGPSGAVTTSPALPIASSFAGTARNVLH